MRRYSDVVLAVFVVAISAMLLVPLPTLLLDFLLVINISISLVFLLVGLYTPDALKLLAFPSLLLLTTLFRLGLNVASTRLILSQADAGRVIEAFGTFLIRGEIVVGIIIFTIVTIVNFIVIARGSIRVSEVAARFALDALPGKQLAIDSDLRSGRITPEEAQQKREELKKESQLYGAMDGAMKFVQGDAIAGFFIIFTNIIGGIYLGVSNGLTFSDAVYTYSVLTVGDGLVSQIPAIFIAICAGIVVTRISSGENATLGSDVGLQLFQRPDALFFCGVILFAISLFPGLPTLPFLVVGFFLATVGVLLYRSRQREQASVTVRGEVFTPASGLLPAPAALGEEEFSDSQLVIYLDGQVLFKHFAAGSAHYRAWWKRFQGDFYNEVGILLAEPAVLAGQDMSAGEYIINVNRAVVERATLPLDAVFVEMNPDSAQLMGLEIVQDGENGISGGRVFWAQNSAGLRRVVEAAHLRTYDFMEYAFMRAALFIQQHPEEALSAADVHSMMKQVEKKNPGFLSEACRSEMLSVSRITDILLELVRQGVSIRDFRQVVEAITGYCASCRKEEIESGELDIDELLAHVRLSRRRQSLARLLSARGTVKVVTLSDEVEQAFEELVGERVSAGALPLEPEQFQNLNDGLCLALDPIYSRGVPPVAVLCRSEICHTVARFIRSCEGCARVVTFDELDPLIGVEQVGVWGM